MSGIAAQGPSRGRLGSLTLLAAAVAWSLATRSRPGGAVAPPDGGRGGELEPPRTPRRHRVRATAHSAVLAAALGCFAFAIRGTDVDAMGRYGLLDALPPTWFAGLALVIGGFVAALAAHRPRPALLGLYVIALVLVVHGTTPLLYDEPRFAWTYKHVGVIEYVIAHGTVDPAIDIYQNWPGFFALNAWFSEVAGVAPLDYANVAQPLFALAFAGVVLFAVRGLTVDIRVQWGAVWLFVLANWVAQEYLAPQALGFVLLVAVTGLALRCAPVFERRLARRTRWERRPLAPDRETLPLAGPAALAVGAICFVAMVVTHQLTPVVAIMSLAALALVARRIPLWALAAMVAVDAAWIARSWPFLSAHYDLLEFNPLASPAPPSYSREHPVVGLLVANDASRVSLAVMLALALAGLVRLRRAGHRDLAAVALASAPVSIIVMQSYGGEARLRIVLFALPWLAFLAAAACAPPARGGLLRRTAPIAASSAILVCCLLLTSFAREPINRIARGDVAASTWYERHAPAGSSLAFVAPNFPSRSTARYARVRLTAGQYEPAITNERAFRGRPLGARDVPAIAEYLSTVRASNVFLTVSRAEDDYVRMHGTVPGGLAPLRRALASSPYFTVAHRTATTTLFRLRPQSEWP